MGRPSLPLGTYGRIRFEPLPSGKVLARCRVRDHDGKLRNVKRVGRTEAEAERLLKQALADRGRRGSDTELTRDSKVDKLIDLYIAELEARVEEGDLSPDTLRPYLSVIRTHIRPALAPLHLYEVKTSRVDQLIRSIEKTTAEADAARIKRLRHKAERGEVVGGRTEKRARLGKGVAKTARAVLAGMWALAARYDAVDMNPVREVRPVKVKRAPARSLTEVEVQDLRVKLDNDPLAHSRDLVDLSEIELATGVRIGETLAILWEDVDLDAATVSVGTYIIRIKGKGLVRMTDENSKHKHRVLDLVDWAVEVFGRRKPADAKPTDPVFPILRGGRGGIYRDPSNVEHQLGEAFDSYGYTWVTSHVWRKTLASIMEDEGCTATQAADQLGHAKVSMTQDVYFGRKKKATGVVKALSRLAPPERIRAV